MSDLTCLVCGGAISAPTHESSINALTDLMGNEFYRVCRILDPFFETHNIREGSLCEVCVERVILLAKMGAI